MKTAAHLENKAEGLKESVRPKSALRENIELMALALFLALVIKFFVIGTYNIPSASMEPTLMRGDQISVNRFIYGVRVPFINKVLIPVKRPQRGDVVVFKFMYDKSSPKYKAAFIKRVVAVGGDTVEIKGLTLYINGEKAQDSHGVYRVRHSASFGPVKVPKDHFFVMGDNRDHSYDSRYWGFVDYKDLMGKALMIHYSWDRFWFDVRWDRLGNLLT